MRSWKICTLFTLSFVTIDNACANFYLPRVTGWGLGGVHNQGRGDLLFPLYSDPEHVFYTDIQGTYAENSRYYAGFGAGFRSMFYDNVYGAYLFVDRDKTRWHSMYTVVSPGIEAFFSDWDWRVNTYFPVKRRGRNLKSFLASDTCDCGAPCENTQFIHFIGHQQFVNRFTNFEQAGPGADAEVGLTFHQLNNTQLHAGVYYFNYDKPGDTLHFHNTRNITGIEARLEVPTDNNVAVTLQGSYDNYQRGAILVGLRFNIFGSHQVEPNDMSSHLLDPIPRNLGTYRYGSGIPTVKTQENDGLFLERDNIYFFTSQGGAEFVDPVHSGTFENPLRNDQFSQTVLDDIGNNANLYVNSGSYTITGAGTPPNASINLPLGDSIFGRTLDFKSSATGAARPTLLGKLNLFFGNNTLDSIQLINSESSLGTVDQNVVALNIQNAQNVFLCNDNINATATVNGNLQTRLSNFATGIFTNNSQVSIQNSTISADAIVTGTIEADPGIFPLNGAFNFAAGIGGNTTSATSPVNIIGNQLSITNSTVSAIATANSNHWDNLAVGIGTNAANGGTAVFNGNNFTISNSLISGTESTATNSFTAFNLAMGIGNLDDGLELTSDFTSNIFTINNTQISAEADLAGANQNFNMATGIGTPFGNFANNTFTMSDDKLTDTAMVGGINVNNQAIGIGTNYGTFNSNSFTMSADSITSTASVSGTNNEENSSVGIGSDAGTFEQNNFNISKTTINANTVVNNDNLNLAESCGIGDIITPFFTTNRSVFLGPVAFGNNTFSIMKSAINASTIVTGSTPSVVAKSEVAGINFANTDPTVGGNTLSINQSAITALAEIGGTNTEVNHAFGIRSVVLGGDQFTVTNTSFGVTAAVKQDNNNPGDNLASGVTLLTTNGSQATIDQSTFDILAQIVGINNTGATNSAVGLSAGGADLIKITNSQGNIIAEVGSNLGTNTATAFNGNVQPDAFTIANMHTTP